MSSLSETPAKALKEKYNLQVFVETGTGKGDGLRYAIRLGFQYRFSCDLDEVSILDAKHLGEAVRMDSPRYLRLWVMYRSQDWPTTIGPTLFWLDAHFPEYYGLDEKPEERFPLLDELAILATKPGIERDVIICDDIECLAEHRNPHAFPEWPVDPELTVAKLVQPLEKTHDWHLEPSSCQNGLLLIFEPKAQP